MKRLLIFLSLFFAFSLSLFGQKARLAEQYYREGEYEKAAESFKQLFAEDQRNDYFFDRYIECLLSLESYPEAEKEIKKQIKKSPENTLLYVTYGNLFERKVEEEKANYQYQQAVEKLTKDRYRVVRLANAFMKLTKYNYAIATYEKGMKLLKDELTFSYNLGDLYRRKGDTPKMIENYLNSLEANPTRLNSIKSIFQRYLRSKDHFQELKKQLYTRVQEKEESIHNLELLAWVFIQQKDYKGALRQMRAIDRRFNGNGVRVFNLAEIAADDKDYDTAIAAYQYIIDNKASKSSLYLESKRRSLAAKRDKIIEGYDYTPEELQELVQEYESFLGNYGNQVGTAYIALELGKLEAFYLNNLNKAIGILNDIVESPGVDPNTQAEIKLTLGDFYLMDNEVWEATLLYSQVDKAFKEDIQGHEARFRNAKLSYFNGDFQWAQAQFEVLKASTSRLIANDALDLSVFIMDNLALDTSSAPLVLYSEADLLVFQNRFEDAFLKLDTLLNIFPDHSLQDDVLYLKAQVYKKQRTYDKAAEALQRIISDFPDEIRADNAMYELAEIYEIHLGDLEKAKNLYERLFIDYSDSTFAVDARKKYRKLRGDNI